MIRWSTIVLIIDRNKKIIVDPGTVQNQKIIINALKKEGLSTNNITHVFITHSHLDHYKNLGMFPSAIVIDIRGKRNKDKYKPITWPKKFNKSDFGNFTKNIHIIKTGGYNDSNLSFFIKGTIIYQKKKSME